MKETRSKKIFDILSSCNVFLSAKIIGQKLGLSSRTIRNEIKDLNNILQANGSRIVMHPGKGCKLEVTDDQKFKIFLSNEWHKYAFVDQDYQSQEYRVHLLLNLLLFNLDGIKAESVKYDFHISDSQFNSDLKEVKRVLSEYNLSINSKPYKGMFVTGSEIQKRKLIANRLATFRKSSSEKNIDRASFYDVDLFDSIRESLEIVLKDSDYHLTQLAFQSLVNHIYVAVIRTKIGIYIDTKDKRSDCEDDEFILAKYIMDFIGEKLGVEFPNGEIEYIAKHLRSKKTIPVNNSEIITPEIQEITSQLLSYVSEILNVDYVKDMELYISLARHLIPLIERIKYGFELKNPIIQEVKYDYLAWEAAKLSSKFLKEKMGYVLTEDEVGYFAIHFSVANYRNQQKINKIDILIVTETGDATAKIIKQQFLKFFERSIRSISTMDYLQAEKEDLLKYDLLVSPTDVQFYSPIPILKVDLYLDETNLSNIRGKMKKIDKDMMYKVFKEDAFMINEGFENDFKKTLGKMSDVLTRNYKFSGDLLTEILDREKMGSTAIGNGVAMPHPLHPISEKDFVGIYLNKDGIKWFDDIVYVVFVICSSKNEMSDYMKLFLYNLTYLTKNQKRIYQSAKCKSLKSFLNTFLDEL